MKPDPVDVALARLRAHDELPDPDPRLEARLVASFGRRRRRLARPLTYFVAATGLSGAALAASGADWLRSWWYEVRVGDEVARGVVAQDGERVIPFETDGGETGTVRIRRDTNAGGDDRTRIEIDRRGPASHDVELAEHVDGDRAARLPRTAVDGATSLFEGADVAGRAFELFAVATPDGTTRLLVLREDGSSHPVVETARIPCDVPTLLRRAEIRPRAEGGCVVAFDDDGAAFELVWLGADETNTGVSELATPDGEIRVRVEDAGRR